MAGEEVYDLLACYMRARTTRKGRGRSYSPIRPSARTPARHRRKAEVQLGDP